MRLLVILTVSVTSGCLTLTTGQNAKVLNPGDSAGFVGVSSQTSTAEAENGSDAKTTTTSLGAVVGSRYGVVSGLEIGARGSTVGMGMIDAKWSIVDSEPVSLALGVGVGEAQYSETSGNGSSTTTQEEKYDYRVSDVPIYVSVEVGKMLSLYCVPRYIYINQETTRTDEPKDVSSSRALAVTTGLMLGEQIGIFGELSTLKSLDKKKDDEDASKADESADAARETTTTQMALGFFFGR